MNTLRHHRTRPQSAADVATAVREWHRPLVVHAGLMLGVTLVAAAGLLLDGRTLLGEAIWLKPLKFAFAFGVYGATLAWLLPKLRRGKRLGWWLGTVHAVFASLDVVLIAVLAALGTFSHFHVSQDPLYRVLVAVLEYAVGPIFLANLILAVAVLVQRVGDGALNRALGAGLLLAVGGMITAVWLSGVESASPRTVTDAYGDEVTLHGAHGIGDPDGSGMPVTNWSTTGGDLRVPHFVGLHGIHVLLLLTVLLSALAARYVWLRDERLRARLMGVAAVGYFGLFATVAWQARRGQSLIHPDGATLTAFSAVALWGVVGATVVIAAGRRRVDGARRGDPAPPVSRGSFAPRGTS